MTEYTLKDVTSQPHLWGSTDPVRPNLGVNFKTAKGRSVCGLLADDGTYSAFVCFALTSAVPDDVMSLSRLTLDTGRIAVPYTVWSHRRGAGKTIINKLKKYVVDHELADRVVTLSPPTEMARRFRCSNGAVVFRVNSGSVNFEYPLEERVS